MTLSRMAILTSRSKTHAVLIKAATSSLRLPSAILAWPNVVSSRHGIPSHYTNQNVRLTKMCGGAWIGIDPPIRSVLRCSRSEIANEIILLANPSIILVKPSNMHQVCDDDR